MNAFVCFLSVIICKYWFELLKEPNRTKKCTLSNWENDLDSLQIEYAALDVIFMSEIFEKLFGNDISMQKYAIGMFGQRNPALTKNTIHSQRVLPVKAEPNHVDDTPVNIDRPPISSFFFRIAWAFTSKRG